MSVAAMKPKKDKESRKITNTENDPVQLARELGFEGPLVEESDGSALVEAEDEASEGETIPHDRPSKKRQRDTTQISELEIDINAPEPSSKKALRKAKRQKPSSNSNSMIDPSAATSSVPQTSTSSTPATGQVQVHGIWVGNLPFTITKTMLTDFLTANSEPSIPLSAISRVHLPAPVGVNAMRGGLKAHNKGFAYVDFTTQDAFVAALALTEQSLGGRRVLIKDARSFEGRPSEHGKDSRETKTSQNMAGGAAAKPATKPTKRVFVGNLGFDVTKEDLMQHYKPCGDVEDIHMATFEDSGKCKGFAWVTFTSEDAAQQAVQGWTKVPNKDDEAVDEEAGEDEQWIVTKDGKRKPRKKRMMKWFVNRLAGRDLRVEFAEDATTRYNKRFGKEKRNQGEENGDTEPDVIDAAVDAATGPRKERRQKFEGRHDAPIQPGAPTDPNKRRSRHERNNGPRHGAESTRYRTGATAESTGTKITFD